MTVRETRRADELVIGDHIFDSRTVREITGAHTVGGRTTLMDSDGESWRVVAGTNYQLATDEEIADQQRERDQRTVGNALRALGSAIVDRRLPVPAGGRGVVVSFDLADDADLKPWEQWLSKRPRRGTSRPLIQAEAEGVEVYVYGPGNSGEFGPDLVEDLAGQRPCARCGTVAVLNSVELCTRCALDVHVLGDDTERRDAVGAFPVVAQAAFATDKAGDTWARKPDGWTYTDRDGITGRTLTESDLVHYWGPITWLDEDRKRIDPPKPAPVGYPLGDGHRPTPPPEAYQADRYDNGRAEA